MFNYMLHHADDYTIKLLQEGKRVARSHMHIVIEEDLQGTTEDQNYREFKHEWHGTFRSRHEWLALFSVLGLKVVHEAAPPLGCNHAFSYKTMTCRGACSFFHPRRGCRILDVAGKGEPRGSHHRTIL